MALKAYQSWHESEEVLVNVDIVSGIGVTNKIDGMGVCTRTGRSTHWGNDLFKGTQQPQKWKPRKRKWISKATKEMGKKWLLCFLRI